MGFQLLAAIAFYTAIPIPHHWRLDFTRIARFAPLVGLLLGGLLAGLDSLLDWLHLPFLTRSALIVTCWILLTGGLHLDGAMDTADGLAVTDRKRRLEVMSDSATGAFGAIAGILIIVLKTSALSEIESLRGLLLITVAAWGRWGQVVAIAAYPYLKSNGKGAFHKEYTSFSDSLWSLFLLLLWTGGQIGLYPGSWYEIAIAAVFGCAIPLVIGAWLYQQLSGHTGDTYGAIVEWSEALQLCALSVLF